MKHILTTALILLAAPGARAEAPAARFAFQRNDEGVLLSELGKPVLFFQLKERSQAGKWPRANYVHPLYGLEGEVLTEDFPDDHGHHRGVFWAWHQLKRQGQPLADPWICKDIEWLPPAQGDGVQSSADDHAATLTVVRQWTVPDQGQRLRVVEERAAITAYARTESERRLDFELRLRALVDGISIGGSEDPKGYGGFSTRVRLVPGITFLGPHGEVAPTTNATKGGAWISLLYPRTAQATSLAVFCHPSHPGFPPAWILRRSRSMQNVAWPGRHPVPLSQRSDLVLQYRVLLHRGYGPERLEQAWRTYGQNP